MRPSSLPSLHQVMVAGGEEPELEQLSSVSRPAEMGHTSLLRLTLRGPTVRETEIICHSSVLTQKGLLQEFILKKEVFN